MLRRFIGKLTVRKWGCFSPSSLKHSRTFLTSFSPPPRAHSSRSNREKWVWHSATVVLTNSNDVTRESETERRESERKLAGVMIISNILTIFSPSTIRLPFRHATATPTKCSVCTRFCDSGMDSGHACHCDKRPCR